MNKDRLNKILDIKNKIVGGSKFNTEEATKNGLILPLLSALGYNVFDTDEVTPEAVADFGSKKGEKVDYAIKLNGQTVMLIECKQLGVSLSDQHIAQLYRYFTASDVHIGVLTNGNDYWFFTDSEKKNIMDKEPYLKLSIRNSEIDDIRKLDMYSKERIKEIDVASDIQYTRFKIECQDFITDLLNGNIRSWVIDKLEELSCIDDGDRVLMAGILSDVVNRTIKEYKANKENAKDRLEVDERASNIKLNHEYIFDDYSDGNWMFHTLDYAIVMGDVIADASGADVLCSVVQKITERSKKNKEILIKNFSNKVYEGIEACNKAVGKVRFIEEIGLGVQIKLGWNDIVKTIAKMLDTFEIEHREVKLSFKK